uniref:Uncharacterized protein n=1 Tax=Anopheles christyi TaxID=43041 RepID=A0A182JV14_9DIPT
MNHRRLKKSLTESSDTADSITPLMVPSVVILLGLLLCNIRQGVESAPTVVNSLAKDSSLHMLPLKQGHVGDDFLSSFQTLDAPVPHSRTKRAIIFRPLFVYRQQQIQRQKHQTTPSPYGQFDDNFFPLFP